MALAAGLKGRLSVVWYDGSKGVIHAVSCIGKSSTTGSTGIAKITFPKGTAVGKHGCTAGSTNYHPGKVTITVT